MNKKITKKDNVIDFPNKLSSIEKEIEAIVFAAAEPLDIETIENGLEKVEQLRGVTYTRNDFEEQGQQVGVIAQEIEEVLPQVVKTASDEMETKSVDYGKITAVLIEAVKELSARVKELENK